MKFLKNEKGFTLIELVIIIVILGILAATAIPRFVDMTDKAEEAACKGALGGLRGGISIWYANKALLKRADFPDTSAELQDTMSDGVLPENPYNNLSTVSISDAYTKGSEQDSTVGWMYNSTNGQIWSSFRGDGQANTW